MTAPATGTYPYVVKIVRDYLIPLLEPGIRITTSVPAARPAKLVTVTTVSTSGGDNIALSPRRVIIHCYHADEATAAGMAETVCAHMQSAYCTPGNGIRDVVVVGTPARYDDPDDATPRFQMTLDVLLRTHFE